MQLFLRTMGTGGQIGDATSVTIGVLGLTPGDPRLIFGLCGPGR